MEPLTPIERGIVATLAYFDVFDYPLKTEEIVRWFFPQEPNVQATPEAIANTLQTSGSLRLLLDVQDGWYALKGRMSTIATRLERARIAKRKWRIAERGAKQLGVVPFLRLAAVVNTLAFDNVRAESDIDLFLVSAPNRLWTMRFFATALLDLFRLRRKGDSIADRICLSFYVSEAALNLEPLRLQPDDPYLNFWIDQAVLMFGSSTFTKFRSANSWIRDNLPFAFSTNSEPRVDHSPFARGLQKIGETILAGRFGNWVERRLKTIQLRKMDQNTESKAKADTTDVVISDTILKFHEADRRAEYRKRFRERLHTVLNQPEQQ